MKGPTVLVADNNKTFLHGCSANVRSAGFNVFTAESVAQVEKLIQTGRVHVAVLDIRLTDDNNTMDTSGADLAKRLPQSVGIVLQSQFLKENSSQFLSRLSIDLQAEAIDKDAKNSDEDLIDAIQRQFEKRVKINFNLKLITHEGDLAPANLVLALSSHYTSVLSETDFSERIGEMEDLLRKVFYDCDELRLIRIFWSGMGNAAVLVEVSSKGLNSSHILMLQVFDVEKGSSSRERQDLILQEQPMGIRRYHEVETVHYHGWLIQLDARASEVTTLDHVALRSYKRLKPALSDLLTRVLSKYRKHASGLIAPQSQPTLVDVVCRQYHMRDTDLQASAFESALHQAREQLILQGRKVEFADDRLFFQATTGDPPFQADDVIRNIAACLNTNLKNRSVVTPGLLSLPRILYSKDGLVWPVQLEDAYVAPDAWDFASVETSLRCDIAYRFEYLVESEITVGDQYLFEQGLSSYYGKSWNKPNSSLLPKPLSIYVEAIGHVRNLAMQNHANQATYTACLLVHLTARLLKMPLTMLAGPELHHLTSLFMALITTIKDLDKMTTHVQNAEGSPNEPVSIQIVNEEERKVRIQDNVRVLGKTGFRLFNYMLLHRGRTCTYQEIFQYMQDGHPQWMDTREQKSAVNQLIHRLREEIEENPSKPTLLVNVRDVGYRLLPENGTGKGEHNIPYKG